jgi:hypothetical protein
MRSFKTLKRHRSREADAGDAFVRDFRTGSLPIDDGDVEAMGAEFIWGATSNQAAGELARDEVHAAELGGLVIDRDDEDPAALALFG